MNIEEENIADVILQGHRHLGHVHFADNNRRPVGNGHTDIKPIAQALREIEYKGFISAEAFAWPSPSIAAKTTIESFNRYFS